jgi:hypothetical protein
MKQKLLSTYVMAVVALAAWLTAWLANDYPLANGASWAGVLMWTLAVGPQTVAFPRQRIQITMSDCFVFYGILVYGPFGGITAAFVGTLGAIQFSERKPKPTQAMFNLGAMPLAAALAGMTFEALNGASSLPLRVLAAATVFSMTNTLLVAVALTLAGKRGHRSIFSFPTLAFITSVFVTAGAGALLAHVSTRGPGDYAVAGVVVVGFLAGKIIATLRDRSEEQPETASLPEGAKAQPVT